MTKTLLGLEEDLEEVSFYVEEKLRVLYGDAAHSSQRSCDPHADAGLGRSVEDNVL